MRAHPDDSRSQKSLLALALSHVARWGLWSNFAFLLLAAIIFSACSKLTGKTEAWEKVIAALSSLELMLATGLLSCFAVGVSLLLLRHEGGHVVRHSVEKVLEMLSNAAIAFMVVALVSGTFSCDFDWAAVAASLLALFVLFLGLLGAGLVRMAATLQWEGPYSTATKQTLANDLLSALGIEMVCLGFIFWVFNYAYLVELIPEQLKKLPQLPILFHPQCPWL